MSLLFSTTTLYPFGRFLNLFFLCCLSWYLFLSPTLLSSLEIDSNRIPNFGFCQHLSQFRIFFRASFPSQTRHRKASTHHHPQRLELRRFPRGWRRSSHFSAVKTQKLRVENESLPFSYFIYCVSKGIITAIYSIVCSFSPRSLQVLPFGSPVSPVSTFGECISLVERMETRPIAFDLLSFLLFPRFHFLKGRNAQTDAAATLPRLNWMAETPLLRFIEAKSIEFSAEPTSFSQNLQKSALFWSTNQFDVPFSLSSL